MEKLQSRRQPCHGLICLSVLVCMSHLAWAQIERRVTIPPLVISQPPKVMAFREGESIEMPCVASGEPQPNYRWQMNEKDFDPSGNDGRIAIQPGVGTLIFARPIERDEGIYQCFAENIVGTALTVKIDLRQAILESFQNMVPRSHHPTLGHKLTLRCVPPRSFPKADVFWATIADGQRFTPIDLTNRVTMDPEGNLHFANVLPEDKKDGRTYACIVQNTVMRSIQQGEYAHINPQGQTIQYVPPAILWQSPTHQIALRGDTWRVKCIFSGSPTPRVDWARVNGIMPSRSRQESFGQELVIENVQFEDMGRYECQGINDGAEVPIRRSFDLSVEASPFWVQLPESVNGAEQDEAVFHCKATGNPDPVYFWFINGVSISKMPADPRRVVEQNKITFHNMSKEDASVIQCNSTNKHGYIWQNAYLNVLTEPPIILDPPKDGRRAAEGKTINLTCQVFGSPKPLVVWRKGSEQLTGGRFKVMESGHLEIDDLSLVDAGVYTCTATNKFDTVSATGSLIVRRKTRIQTQPLDVTVFEGTEAKFTCTATTDPMEVQNMKIDWKKDGQLIDYALAQRVFKNKMDNSLTISGTISLDTGKYTCMASNGLDEDEGDAQLVVQAPPDPPNNVWVLCTNNMRKAEISWQPGKENYAPILNFIIQFNTSFTQDTWYDIATNVSQNQRRQVVTLSPWGNYTFRVLARNKIGISPPSMHTQEICRTEPDVPDRNPDNVIGEGDMPDNLVIFWTPMPRIEQNGPDFRYIVSWKRMDIPDAVEEVENVQRAEAWHYVVPERQETYKPFEIRVKAANTRGDSTVEPKMVIGYSGEDTPLVQPNDVTVDPDSVASTEAVLHWTQVNTDPDAVRGFFRGYRVQFARTTEWPENIREQDFILREPNQFPRPRIKRDLENEVIVKLMYLPPFSDIQLQVRVLNKYFAGPPSTFLNFRTNEGEPGPPAMMNVLIRGSTHFELEWDEPYEPNGILVGYNISYQTITGLNLGRLQYREAIPDPTRSRARLTGLMPDTYYRVYLAAASRRGKGEPIFIDMATLPAGPPSPPTFMITGWNESYINVTWEPSRSANPGSVFYVQYRPRGSYEWLNSPNEVLRFFMEIHRIDSGTTYQVRVVSKNGEGYESPSEWQEVHTSGIAPGHFDLSAALWFYGIFIALILIIILLVLFVVLKKFHTDLWWMKKENEIEDQVRQLQAEEAARQMGVFNDYAETGSREMLAEGQDYKQPLQGQATYDDDYDQQGYNDPAGYGQKGAYYDQGAQGYDPSGQGYDPSGQGYDPSANTYDEAQPYEPQAGYDQAYAPPQYTGAEYQDYAPDQQQVRLTSQSEPQSDTFV